MGGVLLATCVPSVALQQHSLPVLLGITLLHNHRSSSNCTVTFRTPYIQTAAFYVAGAKNGWSDSISNVRVAAGSVVETGSACWWNFHDH